MDCDCSRDQPISHGPLDSCDLVHALIVLTSIKYPDIKYLSSPT